MSKAEELILRGLHLIIRASFAPNAPDAQAKHFLALQQDIGPWLIDYAKAINQDSASSIDGATQTG